MRVSFNKTEIISFLIPPQEDLAPEKSVIYKKSNE
jgi:hypothetical protein